MSRQHKAYRQYMHHHIINIVTIVWLYSPPPPPPPHCPKFAIHISATMMSAGACACTYQQLRARIHNRYYDVHDIDIPQDYQIWWPLSCTASNYNGTCMHMYNYKSNSTPTHRWLPPRSSQFYCMQLIIYTIVLTCTVLVHVLARPTTAVYYLL